MSTHLLPHAWFLGAERVTPAFPDARTAQEFWCQGARLLPVDAAGRPLDDNPEIGPCAFMSSRR